MFEFWVVTITEVDWEHDGEIFQFYSDHASVIQLLREPASIKSKHFTIEKFEVTNMTMKLFDNNTSSFFDTHCFLLVLEFFDETRLTTSWGLVIFTNQISIESLRLAQLEEILKKMNLSSAFNWYPAYPENKYIETRDKIFALYEFEQVIDPMPILFLKMPHEE